MSAMGFVKEGGFLVFRDDSFRRVDNVLIVLRAALATKAKAEQVNEFVFLLFRIYVLHPL